MSSELSSAPSKESKTKLLQALREEMVQMKVVQIEQGETQDKIVKWFAPPFSSVQRTTTAAANARSAVSLRAPTLTHTHTHQAEEEQLWADNRADAVRHL